jgi:regulator of sigma E protease
MPANALGLLPGDVFVSIEGKPIRNNQEVIEIFGRNRQKPVTVHWRRNDQSMEGVVTPTEDGKIGISIDLLYSGPQVVMSYSLIGAFPVGLRDFARVTTLSVQQIWLMITGEESFVENVGGPVKIAQFATQSAELGISTFLGFMAVLSISLAILNILPFPALDGGHFLFLVYEAIFRREIPVKIRLILQQAGFALLIAFMAFVILNDIVSF